MKIRILATSDVHGYITPFKYSDRSMGGIGLSSAAVLINQYRDENTIVVDNGDSLQGSPLVYHHQLTNPQGINPMALANNLLKLDYVNVGNHDFNYGVKYLKKYMHDLNATCLCGNILEQGKPLFQGYKIHTFPNQVKVALFGVVTQYVPHWERSNNIESITFMDAYEYTKKMVEYLKTHESVDYIVCMYHGGIEADLLSGTPTETQTGENQGYRMAHEIEGLDVLITGHQHRSIASTLTNTLITQTSFNGTEVAMIELDTTKKEKRASLLKVRDEYDQNYLDLIELQEAQTQQWLDQPLGELKKGDLLIHDLLDARIHKHPIVSFLNQVQLSMSGAQCSAVALANDVTGFNQKITMRDLVSTYVYPNTLVVLEVTGKILKEMLERCATYFEVKDNKIIVSESFRLPKPQHYNYDMLDGIHYTIHCSADIGSRITDFTYQGKAIKADDILTLVVNNYRASGGGEFEMLKDCKVIKEIQRDMLDCMAEYITERKVIEVDHHDNIKVII